MSHRPIAWLLLVSPVLSMAADGKFSGKHYQGRGDVEYLELLDTSRRMFEPDPEFLNLSMLYNTSWNGLVEGPTWGAWWIQNSYGTSYCALPFLGQPFVRFLENSQALWFDLIGDGKREGCPSNRRHSWVAPDGQLCDAAWPGCSIHKQGDGRTAIHDWGLEFTAAGVVLESELLLINRDPVQIRKYLPLVERAANFLDTRRDPKNNLFLAGPAANLLAPSYAGWKKPDGTYGKAYLAGLSVTYIAALDRLIELEKMVGNADKVKVYSERRESARKGLPLLQTQEGYLIKSLDPDGVRHGVYGAGRHGYFEASPNHDAICFRVVDDAQARQIFAKMESIPQLRPHAFIIPNYPAYDDMYEEQNGIWRFGHWVNGGHWSTCEARMIMAYYRLGKHEDARRSMRQLMKFARSFRMDNPLTEFGNDVYQPKLPINITYDAFGGPAALIRGLFEYLYTADGVTLAPHIPPGITELEQLDPIRFGAKKLYLSSWGVPGPIRRVLVNGKAWKRFDAASVFLPDRETPDRARIDIVFDKGRPRPGGLPSASRVEPPDDYEAAHVQLVKDAEGVIQAREQLRAAGKLPPLPPASQAAADQLYRDTARKLAEGLEAFRKSRGIAVVSSPTNDLYRVLGPGYERYDSAAEAISKVPDGTGVAVLAEGYPEKTTSLSRDLFALAKQKKLRLYVEYPGWLPDLAAGEPRQTKWERAVVSSDAFGSQLERLRILALHGCRYVPVDAQRADIVMARVAGFDKAVYGLPTQGTQPVLFLHPGGEVLVATTKLSGFLQGRYAPSEAWRPIWRYILGWLAHGREVQELTWTPVLRPAYQRSESLPDDVESRAFRRGVGWFSSARMFPHPSWRNKFDEAGQYEDRVGPKPGQELPAGDGSLGMLEGFNSKINPDGSQPVRWWLRNDCMGEASMAMALAGRLSKSASESQIARNLNDFIYFNSPLAKGTRSDPGSASFGLVGWNTTAKYYQDMDGFGVYYGDDNARSMLGTMASAALLGSGRWDEPLLRCLLANLRTTGKLGFRENRIDEKPLQKNGWRYYFERETVRYAPHYQAYLWAAFLWAYQQTGYPLFLERARNALRMTMSAYPNEWHWTNGIQQERARMLLPLAWLVRIEDTAEHRGWLKRIASDLLAAQDDSGAIREEIGAAGQGDYGPPKSNEEYGTNEATLIQQNGDPLADLLYTTNFAFLGLHEASVATGDGLYKNAGEKLAKFLCRIQVRSDANPELDGAWFRAFDFNRWDYWASNADAGWGAWSVETGWTQAWITSVLGMRQMGTSLWDLTAGSRIKTHLEKLVPLMLPNQ